jgi:hypothetical protein
LLSTRKSKGIATLAAELAARGFLHQASLATYLAQTNQIERAYEVAVMRCGDYVTCDSSDCGGFVASIEGEYVEIIFPNGKKYQEKLGNVLPGSPPFRFYSDTIGFVRDAGHDLHAAVESLQELKHVIPDVMLYEFNGQEYQEIR